MKHREISEISERAAARRAAIVLLIADRFGDEKDNHTLLAAICDQLAPAVWMRLWEELCERVEWHEALEAGAEPGYDDNGRPEDPERVKEGVREDIAALIATLAADAPAPLRRAA